MLSQKAILCEIPIFDYVEELINYGFAQVSPKQGIITKEYQKGSKNSVSV